MVSCCSDRLLGVGSGIPWLFSLRSLPESCEGLHNELTQLMQAYKAQLTAAGQWDAAMASLAPPVREKLVAMCGL